MARMILRDTQTKNWTLTHGKIVDGQYEQDMEAHPIDMTGPAPAHIERAVICDDRCAMNGEHADGCEYYAAFIQGDDPGWECDYAPHANKGGGTICLCSSCAEVRRDDYGCPHTDDITAASECSCIETALYG